jgi:hypothetical protein
MALNAATLVKDGGALQIGMGAFSDALAHALVLRHTGQCRLPRRNYQVSHETIHCSFVSAKERILIIEFSEFGEGNCRARKRCLGRSIESARR